MPTLSQMDALLENFNANVTWSFVDDCVVFSSRKSSFKMTLTTLDVFYQTAYCLNKWNEEEKKYMKPVVFPDWLA